MCKHTPLLSTVWKEDESRIPNIFTFYAKFNTYLPDWCLQHMSKERKKKKKKMLLNFLKLINYTEKKNEIENIKTTTCFNFKLHHVTSCFSNSIMSFLSYRSLETST